MECQTRCFTWLNGVVESTLAHKAWMQGWSPLSGEGFSSSKFNHHSTNTNKIIFMLHCKTVLDKWCEELSASAEINAKARHTSIISKLRLAYVLPHVHLIEKLSEFNLNLVYLIFPEKTFNLNQKSNPKPLAFQASVQIIIPFRFKYQDSLKSLTWSVLWQPDLSDSPTDGSKATKSPRLGCHKIL